MANLKYFDKDEFACKCGCGKNFINPELMKFCDKIRARIGVPLVVNSGYRCAEHNERVGGSAKSSHLKGLAADLRVPGKTPEERKEYREKMIDAIKALGITRYGVAETFIHIDIDNTKPDAVWSY